MHGGVVSTEGACKMCDSMLAAETANTGSVCHTRWMYHTDHSDPLQQPAHPTNKRREVVARDAPTTTQRGVYQVYLYKTGQAINRRNIRTTPAAST